MLGPGPVEFVDFLYEAGNQDVLSWIESSSSSGVAGGGPTTDLKAGLVAVASTRLTSRGEDGVGVMADAAASCSYSSPADPDGSLTQSQPKAKQDEEQHTDLQPKAIAAAAAKIGPDDSKVLMNANALLHVPPHCQRPDSAPAICMSPTPGKVVVDATVISSDMSCR